MKPSRKGLIYLIHCPAIAQFENRSRNQSCAFGQEILTEKAERLFNSFSKSAARPSRVRRLVSAPFAVVQSSDP